jgi:hypothetical protein
MDVAEPGPVRWTHGRNVSHAFHMWRGPGAFPLRALIQRISQPVSRVLYGPPQKAANVTAIRLGRRLPGASSNLPERLVRTDPGTWPRTAPIRSCSRWGLPCRFRCRKRGALLPHRFTLAAGYTLHARGGLLFCGTIPGVAPAGRYPAPFVRGARTFLPAALSGSPFQDFGGAAVQPTDPPWMGMKRREVKSAVHRPLPRAAHCCSATPRAGRAASTTSMNRVCRRTRPAGSAVEMQ